LSIEIVTGSFKTFDSWASSIAFGAIHEAAAALEIIEADGKPRVPKLNGAETAPTVFIFCPEML
jgi:hypothetical protein